MAWLCSPLPAFATAVFQAMHVEVNRGLALAYLRLEQVGWAGGVGSLHIHCFLLSLVRWFLPCSFISFYSEGCGKPIYTRGAHPSKELAGPGASLPECLPQLKQTELSHPEVEKWTEAEQADKSRKAQENAMKAKFEDFWKHENAVKREQKES